MWLKFPEKNLALSSGKKGFATATQVPSATLAERL